MPCEPGRLPQDPESSVRVVPTRPCLIFGRGWRRVTPSRKTSSVLRRAGTEPAVRGGRPPQGPPMRMLGFITLAASALAAGCDENTGPSLLAESYALARIGEQTPPIPLGPDGGAPFLLADTLRLADPRPRDETIAVLTRIQIMRD